MQSRTTVTSRGQSAVGGRTARTVAQNWPSAVIVFGLGLVLAWTCLLGYGLLKIVALAI